MGSVEVGKIADLVLWSPAFFGIKPEMIIKGGQITASKMGDANASIPTCQPVLYRPMFGAHGKAKYGSCLTFVSRAAAETLAPVSGCRCIGKKDMKYNDGMPEITVNPETYEVRVDGKPITSKPAETLPLTQLYNLF